MQAIEFKSKPLDNVVDVPAHLGDWNNRQVRVILLSGEENARLAISGTFIALKHRNFRFDREKVNYQADGRIRHSGPPPIALRSSHLSSDTGA